MEPLDQTDRLLQNAVRVMLYLLAAGIVVLLLILLQSPLGAIWARLFDAVFGLSSGQATWFITRASGIVAYLLLWLSTVWGLGVSSKFFDHAVPRAFTYDAHEYISLLAIGMTFIHVVILLWDTFAPFKPAQLVVPFISDYRPFWVGIGIVGTYLTLLVTITFYVRKWIGIQAFRAIHWLSFLAFFGVLVHSWFSGTDTNFALTRWMYLGTTLVVVAMTALWLLTRKSDPMLRNSSVTPTPFGMGSEQTVQKPSLPSVAQAGLEPLSLPPLSPKTEGTRMQSGMPVSSHSRGDLGEKPY